MSISQDDSPCEAFLPDHDRTRYDQENEELVKRVWIETKKLWQIVGPAIVSRVASYSMNIVTQAFAGHLGDVQLAAISISNTVIVGFSFGLLLGMASALETLCGQAFGAGKYQMLGIYMQRSWIVLFLCCVLLLPFYICATPILKWLGQPDDVAEASGVAALWFLPLHFSFAFQFPLQKFLQSQLKNQILLWISLVGLVVNVFTCWLLVYVLHFGVAGAAVALGIAMWVMVFGLLGYATCDWCPYLCKLFLDCGNLSSFLLLQPGKLVLQNTAINDGVLEECNDCCGCLSGMPEYQRIGVHDSNSLLGSYRSESGK